MAFTFNITEHIAVINEREYNGEKWSKEINLVSWNGREPKIDIRSWNSDHTKMEKGITFTDEEAERVVMALHNYVSERR